MNKIIISILLLCTVFGPCKAQLIDPGDKPGLTWEVAEMGGTKYSSLSEAFTKLTADNQTVKLLYGVMLEGTTPLSIQHSTTLALNALSLICASGTAFDITPNKVLTLENGTISGSLTLTGGGRLFAGESVKLSSLGVVVGAKNRYRILVTLPGGENAGTVSNVAYGLTPVTEWTRKGNILCCWLPSNPTTLAISYDYQPAGSAVAKYATATLPIAQHAEVPIPSTIRIDAGGNVAKDNNNNQYTTLDAAFAALQTSGGTIELLDNTTLKTAVTPEKDITLDLAKWTLTASAAASFQPTNTTCLHIRNGSLSGAFSIDGNVIADQTVSLTAAVTQKSIQVYRTRVVLPDKAEINGKTLTYKYDNLNGSITPIEENATQVAYLWLPAHAATSFTLTITGGATPVTKTKNGVVIQANHDNNIHIKIGDIEAILYKSGETPGTNAGIPYETFHEALNEAGKENGSEVWLQRNVSFSGEQDHDHPIIQDVITELHLNGYTMSATNCTLDATATGACLRICDADKGLGSITGTFRIKGNVYIGKDITAGKIGTVLDGSGSNLYRVLVMVDGSPADGLATYSLENGVTDQPCYIKEKVACIWLPAGGTSRMLTLKAGGETYTASLGTVNTSHGNSITVYKPAVVAKIDQDEYTSLTEAFNKAVDGNQIVLQQNTTLNAPVNIPDKKLSLDLQEFTLTMDGTAGFSPSGSGNLLVTSTNTKGTIAGNFTVTADVCVDESVSISNQVQLGGNWVYRVCFYLPEGTNGGTWSYNSQKGTLFLSGTSITNQMIAYAWLQTENGAHELKTELTGTINTPKTLTDISIQSNHYNRFDMEAGTNLAKVGNTFYATFSSALEAANAVDGTVVLVKDQTLRGLQEVSGKVKIDLNGHVFSSTADAGFKVKADETLYITDASGMANKGFLYGDLLIEGLVYVDPVVKLSGTIVCGGQEVCRLLVNGLPEETNLIEHEYTLLAEARTEKALRLGNTACLWIPTTAAEDELLFTKGGVTYEATLPATLSGHHNEQKGYKRIEVSGNETWADGTNKDCNVLLKSGAILTIEASGPSTLHRLTIEKGAQVLTDKNVLATAGIVHRRSFANEKIWESFSLPYEAKRITAIVDKKIVELSPNISTGTGGHFWLQTLAADGSFRHVAEETLRANVGYVIAVPIGLTTENGLTDRAVSFVSAPNQYLKRTEVVGTAPIEKGFRQFATGVLKDLAIQTAFYQLSVNGQEYVRQAAGSEVPPFSSYLLADAATTATTKSLRLDNLPATNEETGNLQSFDCLVSGGKGYIKVVAKTACLFHIFTPDGRLKQTCHVAEGETRLSMPSGLYLINRQKVYVSEY